jgi:hypothetical protein
VAAVVVQAVTTTLFTDCAACQGVGCRACRDLCRICEQQGRETLVNAGGHYCDAHDPSTCPLPL